FGTPPPPGTAPEAPVLLVTGQREPDPVVPPRPRGPQPVVAATRTANIHVSAHQRSPCRRASLVAARVPRQSALDVAGLRRIGRSRQDCLAHAPPSAHEAGEAGRMGTFANG